MRLGIFSVYVCLQATVEKILKCVKDDNKDVRKATWSNKEVGLNAHLSIPLTPFTG